MNARKIIPIVTVLFASLSAACLEAERDAPSSAPEPDLAKSDLEEPAASLPFAQPVPVALRRQIMQSLSPTQGGQTLAFFSQGIMADGPERFRVAVYDREGEQQSSVVYDHGSQTLQGCIDEACARKAPEVEFFPVKLRRGSDVARQPSPACVVEFYWDRDYTGNRDCYQLLPGAPSVSGTYYIGAAQVYSNEVYTSHKTYDRLCSDQGISSVDCTSSNGYLINVARLMVWKNAYQGGYDRELGDAAANYDSLRWCDLCGKINDAVSSFEAEVLYTPRWSISGSVAQGVEHHYPFDVVPGTNFRAKTTGTSDPDLYVRFGTERATTGLYDCASTSGSANELCERLVPAGVSKAWVMVRGYTTATYKLEVNYNFTP